jgi:hypothetical protein
MSLLLATLAAVAALAMPAFAGAYKGDVGIGLNYPGLGVRYMLSDRTALEAKAQVETGILVAGLRWYRSFSLQERSRFFWGLEGDYVNFTGEVSKGNGYAAAAFVGGEYFAAKRLSLQMDLGPAYIGLTDGDTTVSVNGVEFVLNLGINYYLGGK